MRDSIEKIEIIIWSKTGNIPPEHIDARDDQETFKRMMIESWDEPSYAEIWINDIRPLDEVATSATALKRLFIDSVLAALL